MCRFPINKGFLVIDNHGMEGKDKANTKGAKATDNGELSSKKKEMAGKMKGNTPAMAKKNMDTAMSIDAHNKSWNGKRYTK